MVSATKGKKTKEVKEAEPVASTSAASTKNTALHLTLGLEVAVARVRGVYQYHGVNRNAAFVEGAIKYAFCEHNKVTKTRKVLKKPEEETKPVKGKKTKKSKKGKEEAEPVAASTAPVKVEENYVQIELGKPDLKKVIPLAKITAKFNEYIDAIQNNALTRRTTNPLPAMSGADHKRWLSEHIDDFVKDRTAAEEHLTKKGKAEKELEGKYTISAPEYTYGYYMHIVKYYKFHFEKRAEVALTAYQVHLIKDMIRHIQSNKKLEQYAATKNGKDEESKEVKSTYYKISDLLERIEGESRLFEVLRKSPTFMKLYTKYHDIQTRIQHNDALVAALSNRTINKPETENAKSSKPQTVSPKILGTPELVKSLDVHFKDLDPRWKVHNFCAYINTMIQNEHCEHREKGSTHKITVRTDLRDFMSHIVCEIIQVFSDAASSLVKYANQRTIKQHAIMHAAEFIGTTPSTNQEMLDAVARHDDIKAHAVKKPKVKKVDSAASDDEDEDESDEESGDE